VADPVELAEGGAVAAALAESERDADGVAVTEGVAPGVAVSGPLAEGALPLGVGTLLGDGGALPLPLGAPVAVGNPALGLAPREPDTAPLGVGDGVAAPPDADAPANADAPVANPVPNPEVAPVGSPR
jgi:hypothetical protein